MDGDKSMEINEDSENSDHRGGLVSEFPVYEFIPDHVSEFFDGKSPRVSQRVVVNNHLIFQWSIHSNFCICIGSFPLISVSFGGVVGYHASLTHSRSRVRFSSEVYLFLPFLVIHLSSQRTLCHLRVLF